MSPVVAVLLSTYNGETFLAQQLDSLLAQTGVQVELFVRDDGSSDGTLELLRSYAHAWPRLALIEASDNIGAGPSFLRLLRDVPSGYGYYAFCDQDDVWFPDKLGRAVSRLERSDPAVPTLYCSNFLRTDERLEPIGPGVGDDDGRFEHLLFESIAWGCTSVLNPAARDLIAERLPKSRTIIHDWWCSTVVAAFGEVLYDPEPSLLYRQHGRNVVGLERDRLSEILGHARRFLKNPSAFYPIHERAAEMLEIFGERMDPRTQKLVADLAGSKRSARARGWYALSAAISRRRRTDAAVVRALLLAGWY